MGGRIVKLCREPSYVIDGWVLRHRRASAQALRADGRQLAPRTVTSDMKAAITHAPCFNRTAPSPAKYTRALSEERAPFSARLPR